MGMEEPRHLLGPGLELSLTAELDMQLLSPHIDHGLAGCGDQGVIDRLRTILRELVDLSWSLEHRVQILRRQQVLDTGRKPVRPRLALTLRTVPVAARPIDNVLDLTLFTRLEYRSHRFCSAAGDGNKGLLLGCRGGVRAQVPRRLASHYLGQIDHRPRLPRSSNVLRGHY